MSQRKESFWNRNVKVVTFIACLAVFFVLCGPINVFNVGEYIEKWKPQKPEMTVEDVVAFSQNPTTFRIETLRKTYRGEYTKSTDGEHESFTSEFDHYFIYVYGETESGAVLSCTVSDNLSGEALNLIKGDAAAYFEKTDK